MSFIAIIPARYASTRLPGKPLADIHGKPMVVHVMERARESGASRVIVATDHPEVAKAVEAAGGEVCMTSPDHHSGTERLAEVIAHYGFADDQIIVNVQGDEPLIPPVIVRQVAENGGQPGRHGDAGGADRECRRGFQPQRGEGRDGRAGLRALFFTRHHSVGP